MLCALQWHPYWLKKFMINPKTYYFSFAKFIPILLLLSVASLAAALLWMLGYSNTTAIGQADIYWVFYLHIAAAAAALFCYGVVALSSLFQLFEPKRLMPIVFSHGFAPSGFIMTLFALGSGALFGRPMWGAYWIWDSRLTALLILLFFFGAFISLSVSKVNNRQDLNDRKAAVSALLGVVIIPVLYVFFDLYTPMAHDLDNSLLRSNGRDAYVLMILFSVTLFTYMLAMCFSRCRDVILERERRATWAQDAAIEGEL